MRNLLEGLGLPGDALNELLRAVLQQTSEIAVLLDDSGKIVFINHIEPGRDFLNVLGTPWVDWVEPARRKAMQAALQRAIAGGGAQVCEFVAAGRENERAWYEVYLTPITPSEGPVILLIARNISARKHLEFENEARSHVLSIADPGKDLHECMAALTGFLQAWSGCEAVGVRLGEGNDFPYFETRGFPAAFVESEKHLCEYDANGLLLRDAKGRAELSCMCGNILCGRFNPEKSFFTVNGSFWSNNTTRLLASTTDAERQARTRNRCNGSGYESVALVPLRAGDQVFGLLQFNDHAPDRFSPGLMGQLETMGDTLAMALSRRQAAAEREEGERLYRSLFQSMLNGFAYCRMIFQDGKPQDFVYLLVNEAFERHTGLRDVTGKKVSEVIPGIRENDPELFEIYGRVATTGQPEQFEMYVEALGMWFFISVYSPAKEYFVAVFDVINDRKRAEAEVRRVNASLEQRVAERTSELLAANQELDAFAYAVSHDLRAPLRAMEGFSQALIEDVGSGLDREARGYLDHISLASRKMGDLIDGILTLSRSTRGDVERDPVDLSALAARVLEDTGPAANPGARSAGPWNRAWSRLRRPHGRVGLGQPAGQRLEIHGQDRNAGHPRVRRRGGGAAGILRRRQRRRVRHGPHRSAVHAVPAAAPPGRVPGPRHRPGHGVPDRPAARRRDSRRSQARRGRDLLFHPAARSGHGDTHEAQGHPARGRQPAGRGADPPRPEQGQPGQPGGRGPGRAAGAGLPVPGRGVRRPGRRGTARDRDRSTSACRACQGWKSWPGSGPIRAPAWCRW